MIEILIVAGLASLVSFICSIWEGSLYAIPQSRVESLRREGHRGAERLAKLRENIDEPISAILTLNTLSHTMGASLAGALVENHFRENSDLALLLFSILFSLEILFVTEIIPKTLAVRYADRLAPASALPISIAIQVLKPIVWVCLKFTRLITSRGEGAQHHSAPTEDDVLALARMGETAGTLLAEEVTWAQNAMLLDNITVRDLMTPRTVVYSLPADLPMSEVKAHSEHWTHSKLPLSENNDPDRILGVIYRRDVFDVLVQKPKEEQEKMLLRELMRPVQYVPETLKGNEVLRQFLKSRQHLFVVINEFGGMEGVITMEDVLEFLLGEEIVDPHDRHENMQEHARQVARERRKGRPGAARG